MIFYVINNEAVLRKINNKANETKTITMKERKGIVRNFYENCVLFQKLYILDYIFIFFVKQVQRYFKKKFRTVTR